MKEDKKAQLLEKIKPLIQELIKAYKEKDLRKVSAGAEDIHDALEDIDFDLDDID